MNISATPSPYLNLSVVMRGLRGSLGGWGARGFLNQALMFLLYRRLFVICGKMERLVQRFQAGRLFWPGPRPAVSPLMSDVADGKGRSLDMQVWPRRFGWLVRLASWQAAGYGSQLRAVLETPEMVALLVAAPQAVVILRPLCWMLAIETSLLRPRPVKAPGEIVPEAVAGEEGGEARRGRVGVARPPVGWGRIPLPRGVLAAARRQGFGKR